MAAGEQDDLDDSSFSSNIFLLVEMQMMDMDFHLEVQTTIRDVTAKVKSKKLFTALVEDSRQFIRSGK